MSKWLWNAFLFIKNISIRDEVLFRHVFYSALLDNSGKWENSVQKNYCSELLHMLPKWSIWKTDFVIELEVFVKLLKHHGVFFACTDDEWCPFHFHLYKLSILLLFLYLFYFHYFTYVISLPFFSHENSSSRLLYESYWQLFNHCPDKHLLYISVCGLIVNSCLFEDAYGCPSAWGHLKQWWGWEGIQIKVVECAVKNLQIRSGLTLNVRLL